MRVQPHSYLPTKAEMEETVEQHKPDGSRRTPEVAVRALLRPVHVVKDP
ncbi:MAG: hypothetical protein OXF88_19320 [Rhodobacteraceae bacterium]|nr:hypothetical protein [Paracoccaceae bacterium]MCY4140205.1 hypothetical protein [Paracoccaceae bacterium]